MKDNWLIKHLTGERMLARIERTTEIDASRPSDEIMRLETPTVDATDDLESPVVPETDVF